MSSKTPDLNRLCLHTITTKTLSFEEACREYARRGIRGISIWRDAVEKLRADQVKKALADCQLEAVSYVRGGFFPSMDPSRRKAAIDDNLRMIQEASDMEIPLLVLVCGSDPAQSLPVSRAQIQSGIEKIMPEATKLGVRLAIEPLHPMYADTRSAITSLRQANEMAEYFASAYVGVAVDVYHLWFDEHLEQEIARCGRHQNLYAFHMCDWKVPTLDMLNDRGLMGEGCIPLKQIRGWVEDAGFTGYHEVEIFSTRYWSMDQGSFLDQIVQAYISHC